MREHMHLVQRTFPVHHDLPRVTLTSLGADLAARFRTGTSGIEAKSALPPPVRLPTQHLEPGPRNFGGLVAAARATGQRVRARGGSR